MSARLGLVAFAAVAFTLSVDSATASAQIDTGIIEKYRADLQKQASDPEMKRERGTQPQDWVFALPKASHRAASDQALGQAPTIQTLAATKEGR